MSNQRKNNCSVVTYTSEERAISLEIDKYKHNASYHRKRSEELDKEILVLQQVLRDLLERRGINYNNILNIRSKNKKLTS